MTSWGNVLEKCHLITENLGVDHNTRVESRSSPCGLRQEVETGEIFDSLILNPDKEGNEPLNSYGFYE